jgi:hypothetical protein
MAKLKVGQKVVQKFLITLKFRAIEGDSKFKKQNIVELFGDLNTVNEGTPNAVIVTAKEIKENQV